MDIVVERVRSKAELSTFIQAPNHIYATQPEYVPPLDIEQYALLSPRRSAFFSHGYAAYWIAKQDGRVVGRVSAQIDLLANDNPGHEKRGNFGCLDAIEDLGVVNTLLRTAESWLLKEGCTACCGPFMLSINGQSGMLVEGQAEAPMIGMPWSPKYLSSLVEACGYSPVRTLGSYRLSADPTELEFRRERLGTDIKVRSLDLGRLSEESELCRQLFNDAWKENWGFVPICPADMQTLLRELKLLLIPDCAVVAECIGKPAAFLLVVPNIYDAAWKLGPSPSIIGWLRFLYRVKRLKYKSARIILFGVSPDYSLSVRGALIVSIFTEAMRRLKVYGNLQIEAGWVLDDNYAMIKILDYFRFKRVRTYRLFEKRIG